MQQWLHKNHITDSPSQYLADLITLKTIRHCSRRTATTTPLAIVGGDFNATWSDHLGPLKGIGQSHGPEPLFSYYHRVTPKSLIDHLLLSSSCQGHIAYAGVGCDAFFSSISDHRSVLIGLQLHNGHPSMSLRLQTSGSPRRTVDLDLTQPLQVTAYRSYTEGLLTNLPRSASYAWTRPHGYKIKGPGKRPGARDGATMMAGHHRPWHSKHNSWRSPSSMAIYMDTAATCAGSHRIGWNATLPCIIAA